MDTAPDQTHPNGDSQTNASEEPFFHLKFPPPPRNVWEGVGLLATGVITTIIAIRFLSRSMKKHTALTTTAEPVSPTPPTSRTGF